MLVLHHRKETDELVKLADLNRAKTLFATNDIVLVKSIFDQRFSFCDGWDDWARKLATNWGVTGHIHAQPTVGRVTASVFDFALRLHIPVWYMSKQASYEVLRVIDRGEDDWKSGFTTQLKVGSIVPVYATTLTEREPEEVLNVE